MFPASQYQLLDFGESEKLESFAGFIVQRPSPFADAAARVKPSLWEQSDLIAQKNGQKWNWSAGQGSTLESICKNWVVQFGEITLQLKCTDTGQLGVFPEHGRVWRSVAGEIARFSNRHGRPPRVLNLFAYTGGLTLVAAAAGAHVVHLDAAKPAVEWARHNAELSGLSEKPIRWICEHAPKFVQRERNRGNCYDIVVLDPPTYGHGPKNQAWKNETDLAALIGECAELLVEPVQTDLEADKTLIVTCHSVDWPATRLTAVLGGAVQQCGLPRRRIANDELFLATPQGARMVCGDVACWPADVW